MNRKQAPTAPRKWTFAVAHQPRVDIDAKKRLEVLLDALKDAYKELTETALKMSGVLLAVLAWFASKSNPLPMLCSFPWLVPVALVFTSVGAPGLAYLFSQVYERAECVYSDLSKVGYDRMLYERFRVTKPMLRWAVFGLFTMLVGIYFAIASSYSWMFDETCSKPVSTARSNS